MPFNSVDAKTWRTANFVAEKAATVALEILNLTHMISEYTCLLAVSGSPGTAAACTVPVTLALVVLKTIEIALRNISVLSQRIYGKSRHPSRKIYLPHLPIVIQTFIFTNR